MRQGGEMGLRGDQSQEKRSTHRMIINTRSCSAPYYKQGLQLQIYPNVNTRVLKRRSVNTIPLVLNLNITRLASKTRLLFPNAVNKLTSQRQLN